MILSSIIYRLESYDEVIGSAPKGWRAVLKKAGGASFLKSLPRKNAEKLLNQALKQVLKENKSSEKPKEIDIPKTYINEWLNDTLDTPKPKSKSTSNNWEKTKEKSFDEIENITTVQNLNNKEKEALTRYIYEAYTQINDGLRSGKVTEYGKQFIPHLDNIFKKARTKEDIVVFRGTDNPLYDNLQVGDSYSDEGFTSTSASKHVPRFFAKTGERKDKKPVEIEVRVPKGSSAIWANNPSQQEILLDRGANFKVVGIEKPSDDLFSKKLIVELVNTNSTRK